MPTTAKQNISDDKQTSKTVNAVATPVPSDDKDIDEQHRTRTGKEQDAIYREEGQLLNEVKEKYKEADLEAQKVVEQALGSEAKARAEVKIAPDLREAGVASHEENATDVIKKGSDLQIPISEDTFQAGRSVKLGGKRFINRNIVGVSSLAALVIFVGRLVKVAHRHARRIIFRKSDFGKGKPLEDGDNAN